MPVNQLYTAGTLRDFISSKYKRHTIKRVIRPKQEMPVNYDNLPLSERIRQSTSDYFQLYARMVIPQIEAKTEERFLAKFLKQIKNEDEKEEVKLAYMQRRQNLATIMQDDELAAPEPPHKPLMVPNHDVLRVIQDKDGDGVSNQTYSDIGRYIVFPESHWRRMYPRKSFGIVDTEDYSRNKTHGIMCREEGLRITNELHRLTVPSERSIPYDQMVTWSNGRIKSEMLTDDLNYTHMQQDFSIDLWDYIHSYEGEAFFEIKQFFMPPGIFDGVISILLQEVRNKPMRPHLCEPSARKKLIH